MIGGQSGISTVEMERTLKSLNGYHEVEVYFQIQTLNYSYKKTNIDYNYILMVFKQIDTLCTYFRAC